MPDNLNELIQRLLDAISGLGIFLPIGIFVIAQLFSGKDKDKKEQETAPTTRPAPSKPVPATTSAPAPASPGPVIAFPFGPPSWMEMNQPAPTRKAASRATSRTSQWGHTFDKQDEEKEGLQWGSVFEDDDGEPLRWESTFDSEAGKNVYGFERATYGNTFPKKSSDPVIQHG